MTLVEMESRGGHTYSMSEPDIHPSKIPKRREGKRDHSKLWEDITSSRKTREAKIVWKAKDLNDSDFFFK